MKKTFLAVFALSIICVSNAWAQRQMTYVEEVQALGFVAGQGLACGATKQDTFEMLARAIIITKATSDSNQANGMYAFNAAKADAYFSKQMDGFFDCATINRRFDRQDIFKIVLYADGSLKMPDGKVIEPRKPYDARILMTKNDKARQEAQAIYNKGDKVKAGEISVSSQNNTPEPAKKEVTKKTNKQNGIKHIKR